MRQKAFWRTLAIIFIYFFSLISHAEITESKKPVRIDVQETLQKFYQKPSYSSFINITSQLIKEPKAVNLLLIFSTMVVDKHPDYVPQITKNFMSYGAPEKEILFAALSATDNKDAVQSIEKTYHYTNRSPRFTANDIKNLSINDNPKKLDIIWAAYFATGDDAYLRKILEYINADEFMLVIGYEIANREIICKTLTKVNLDQSACKNDLQDLIEAIKKKYPDNSKQMIYKAVVVSTGIWSLEANRRQDEIVNEKINNIIKENPNLDYWKKIKAAMGPLN